MQYTIAIIDDDISILKSIKNTIDDTKEFKCHYFTSPKEALQKLEKFPLINLVIVDVWIPGMDGIQFIKLFREKNKETPILCISGHANLNSSFKIAQLGATDFLEKPFKKDTFIYKIKKLLKIPIDTSISHINNNSIKEIIHSNPIKKQKTIKKSGTMAGQGIHTGNKTGIILSPLPENSGIIFEDIITGKQMRPHIQYLSSAFLGITLIDQDFSISVIEHLMASLSAYEIDNILIKVNKEIPVMDGSSIDFCSLLDNLGVIEQTKSKKEIIIDKIYEIQDEDDPTVYIRVEPYDGFYISYHFDMEHIETTTINIDLSKDKINIFKKEIAPARTFVDINYFQEVTLKKGLGKGLNIDNAIIIDQKKSEKKPQFRLKNELARHKILDICGDTMLLGYPLIGKITAHKSGHRHTVALLKKILSNE